MLTFLSKSTRISVTCHQPFANLINTRCRYVEDVRVSSQRIHALCMIEIRGRHWKNGSCELIVVNMSEYDVRLLSTEVRDM